MLPFWFAPLIVAHRTPKLAREALRMAQGRMPARGRPEFEQMVTEKIVAAQSGAVLSGLAVAAVFRDAGKAAMSGDPFAMTRHIAKGPSRVLRAAIAPTNRKLKANMRRLSAGD